MVGTAWPLMVTVAGRSRAVPRVVACSAGTHSRTAWRSATSSVSKATALTARLQQWSHGGSRAAWCRLWCHVPSGSDSFHEQQPCSEALGLGLAADEAQELGLGIGAGRWWHLRAER